MSKRELHLCDGRTESGPCDAKYYKTCPVCDTECCTSHFGVNPIVLQVFVSGDQRATLATNSVQVCKQCDARLRVSGLDRMPFDELIAPAGKRLVEALRAALAGAALAAGGSQ